MEPHLLIHAQRIFVASADLGVDDTLIYLPGGDDEAGSSRSVPTTPIQTLAPGNNTYHTPPYRISKRKFAWVGARGRCRKNHLGTFLATFCKNWWLNVNVIFVMINKTSTFILFLKWASLRLLRVLQRQSPDQSPQWHRLALMVSRPAALFDRHPGGPMRQESVNKGEI